MLFMLFRSFVFFLLSGGGSQGVDFWNFPRKNGRNRLFTLLKVLTANSGVVTKSKWTFDATWPEFEGVCVCVCVCRLTP